jgi:hypothetical protein
LGLTVACWHLGTQGLYVGDREEVRQDQDEEAIVVEPHDRPPGQPHAAMIGRRARWRQGAAGHSGHRDTSA